MDKVNKKLSEYYEILTEVYQSGLACIGCEHLTNYKLCNKYKDHCAERLYLTMKRLLEKR